MNVNSTYFARRDFCQPPDLSHRGTCRPRKTIEFCIKNRFSVVPRKITESTTRFVSSPNLKIDVATAVPAVAFEKTAGV
jgi:hypothetical protein